MNESIHIDFETFSEVNLKKYGMYKYVEHPSFRPLCAAWSLDHDNVYIWKPSDNFLPDTLINAIMSGVPIRAFNAAFERTVFNKCYRQFGLDRPPRIEQYRCTQAIGAYLGLPLSLDTCGKALALPILKDPAGNRLINMLCKPRKPSRNNPKNHWTPEERPDAYDELYQYCGQDVHAEIAILDALPLNDLPHTEQLLYWHTQVINERGLKIDRQNVENIVALLKWYRSHKLDELAKITGNQVTSIDQQERLLNWFNSNGLSISNIQAETIENSLALPYIPDKVRAVLQLRRDLAKTSTAKFETMLAAMCSDGTVKGTLHYYGAIPTGRYAGRIIQPQNLPREKTENPEPVFEDIEYVMSKSYHEESDLMKIEKKYGSLFSLAAKLIRPVIIPHTGGEFVVADFSKIEYVCLIWAAKQMDMLKEYVDGFDPYTSFASDYFKVPYAEVNDEQYQKGKTCVLGLGYFAGPGAISDAFDKFSEAENAVSFYRRRYNMVKKFWYNLHSAAKAAVVMNTETECNGYRFLYAKNMLMMKLPSGRSLVYQNPSVSDDYRHLNYWGTWKSKQWLKQDLSHSKLVNNAIQGTARDIKAHGQLQAERKGYKIIFDVHDELPAERKTGEGDLQEYISILTDMPEWAKTIPIKAGGYIGQRYKKD